jgi:hypothetical protein
MKTTVKNFTNFFFSLTFCLGLASCNKEDFYEKEYLENPFQDPTTTGSVESGSQGGVDSGMDEGTQGGVDSGVDGGTSGSTTGSSTTGGTSGGVDGSTTGGSSSGSTVGGSSTGGSTTGGSTTGSTTGGSTTGSTTGGSTTGSTTGGSTTGSTTGGSTTGSSTGGYGDCNNGHGNDADGVDESNPNVGTEEKCNKEVFKQSSAQTKKLDIIWIIDNSGSMADEQSSLGTNFSSFIDEFITKDVDFKMAITTTDTSTADKKGKMVTGSDTKLTLAKARANEAKFKDDFKSLVKVGTSGSMYEKGLAASEGFMQKYAASFLRPDAYLAVVVLSDEEDQSPEAVKFYTDYLKSFKSQSGLVKLYSIVDVGLTNKSGSGITSGYQRYADASSYTAGTVSDIRDDFHRSLSAMGDSIINLLDSFALANTPVDGSLRVYVNGVETTSYRYDSSSRSIKFDANSVPAAGSEITVTYVKQK